MNGSALPRSVFPYSLEDFRPPAHVVPPSLAGIRIPAPKRSLTTELRSS